MAQVIQRLLNFQPDAALELRGETWMRKFSFGANWTTLRIGILASLGEGSGGYSYTGGQTLTGLGFLTGICNANSLASYTSQQEFGISWFGDYTPPWTGSTLTLNTGAASYSAYWTSNQSPYYYVKYYDPNDMIQGVMASGATFSGQGALIWPFNGAPRRRSAFIWQISRSVGGGGPVTNTLYYPYASTNQPDATLADVMEMVTQSGALLQGTAMYSISVATQGNTEAFGSMDAFYIRWTNAAVPLYIHGVIVSCVMEGITPELGPTVQAGDSESFMLHGTSSNIPQSPPANLEVPVMYSFLGGLPGWDDTSAWATYGTNLNAYPNYGAFNGTSGQQPFDMFCQYPIPVGNGSLAPGFFSGGTGWDGPWVESQGTQALFMATVFGMAGTSGSMPIMDGRHWVQAEGTIPNGVYTAGTGFGTVWSSGSYYQDIFTGINSTYFMFNEGTGVGGVDYFTAADTGTVSPTLDTGSRWGGPYTFLGTNDNEVPIYAFGGADHAGTVVSPIDRFEQYNTGLVNTDVFINAGTWWSNNGNVYAGIATTP